MKSHVWTAMALMAAVTFPALSQAATLNLSFAGPGVTGALAVSFLPTDQPGLPSSTLPSGYYPANSFIVTKASGTFSDTTIGLASATITGLVSLNPVAPEAGNLLAPASFSLFLVKNGVDGGVPSAGLHYDNLLYPGGSPQTATDYPFKGGLFDIYGLAFTLNNGNVVNLWSNGVLPGKSLDYGVAVTDGTDVFDYTGGVSVSAVPLPAAAPLFGAALLALGAIGYGMKRKTAAA